MGDYYAIPSYLYAVSQGRQRTSYNGAISAVRIGTSQSRASSSIRRLVLAGRRCVAINLQARHTQPGDAMRIDRFLPGMKFFN